MTPTAQRILREVYLLKDAEFPLVWSPMTFAHKFGIEVADAATAVRWLVDNGLMTVDKLGHYWPTSDTEAALARRVARPTTQGNKDAQWKDEALTGMTPAGNKSAIKRAVLPTGTVPRKAPVDMQVHNRRQLLNSIKAVCAESNLTMEQCASLMADGRIKTCRKCGEVRLHGKKGKHVRTPCNFCRSKK